MAHCPRLIPSAALLVLIAIASGPAAAQESNPPPETAACRKFAQEFYDWYLPLWKKTTRQPSSDLAIQRKPAVFSEELLKALKIDAQASARAKGEIVGLDFDPFLGSQDPADRYELRRVSLQASRCLVEIWSVYPPGTAAPSQNPDVVAEVTLDHGRLQFANFRYPELKTDLLRVLSELRAERQKK